MMQTQDLVLLMQGTKMILRKMMALALLDHSVGKSDGTDEDNTALDVTGNVVGRKRGRRNSDADAQIKWEKYVKAATTENISDKGETESAV